MSERECGDTMTVGERMNDVVVLIMPQPSLPAAEEHLHPLLSPLLAYSHEPKTPLLPTCVETKLIRWHENV